MQHKERDFLPLIIEAGKLASTPAFVCDAGIVERNILALHGAFSRKAEICFAIKANNDPKILKTISLAGCGFDVASAVEIDLAIAAGCAPEKLFFSNPVKLPEHVAYAHRMGIRHFCADSAPEIDKLAMHAPGSHVYLRISVDNSGSGWPLSKKFGIPPEDAPGLLEYALQRGLVPYGLTFHVGSQCETAASWRSAIMECAKAWHGAAARGIGLELMNLGGGFPAQYRDNLPTFDEIASAVREAMTDAGILPTHLVIEPGRAVVADASILVATVIGKKKHGGSLLIFLDVGLFNGLMEAYERFWLPIVHLGHDAESRGKEVYCFVGPSCDSVDVVAEDIETPRLDVGDRIALLYAGAYTNSYENYNGFPYPSVRHVSAAGKGTP